MKELTITNAIPVVYRHLKHLENCLDNIYSQTLLPDEIIVIISDYAGTDKDKMLLEHIESKNPSTISLIIQTYTNTQFAGKNRQIAYNLCSSDIIIFQDCDDDVHRQRNEIMRDIFLKTRSPHILHGWTDDPSALETHIDVHNLKLSPKINKLRTANGPIFIHKSIVGKLQFPNNKKGQDVRLNNLISRRYKSVLIVNNNLYIYNNNLSSWKK